MHVSFGCFCFLILVLETFVYLLTGNSLISKALATLDVKYGLLFNDSFWKDNISEKSDGFGHLSQPTGECIFLSPCIDYIDLVTRNFWLF